MKRERSYSIPHKGLRNALSQLSFLAGKTDYSNLQQVEKLYTLGTDVFHFLTEHAGHENAVTLAELEKRAPGSTKHDTEDHEQIHAEQHKLEKLLEKIHNEVKAGKDATDHGEEFYLQLAKFHGDYLNHTNGEERATQAILWAHFTDEELFSHRGLIMSKMTPHTMLTLFKYIVPAQNHTERVGLFMGLKQMAPAPFFNQSLQTVGEVMDPHDFAALQKALN